MGGSTRFGDPFSGSVLEAAKKSVADNGAVKIPLEPTSRMALVHVDDVAEGLRCVVECRLVLMGIRQELNRCWGGCLGRGDLWLVLMCMRRLL